MPRERKYYCVYIMGSLSGTLYTGVSGNLHKRVFQHKFHHFKGFTDRYDVTRLLYWESYDDVHRPLPAKLGSKAGTAPRKSHRLFGKILTGSTWPPSGTPG
jgi:predicted GIY-YIG superfamily endonuclease